MINLIEFGLENVELFEEFNKTKKPLFPKIEVQRFLKRVLF